MPVEAGTRVSVMVNGLGATPKEELLILYRRIHQVLTEKGIVPVLPHIGEYATSMEMAGASISLMRVDTELKEYLAAPADTPFYKQFQL